MLNKAMLAKILAEKAKQGQIAPKGGMGMKQPMIPSVPRPPMVSNPALGAPAQPAMPLQQPVNQVRFPMMKKMWSGGKY